MDGGELILDQYCYSETLDTYGPPLKIRQQLFQDYLILRQIPKIPVQNYLGVNTERRNEAGSILGSGNCPLQRNYDVGDRELLVVKLALEEWRHWLEGAKEPFLLLTDHWNLEYIRTARRLNPHQARSLRNSSRSSGIMAFRRTSSPTMAPNSHHELRAFLEKLGVKISLTSEYRPQSNGQVERMNREVPEESLSGPPALAPWTPGQTAAPAVDEWFRRAAEVWRDANVRLQHAVHRQKEQADHHRTTTLCSILGTASGSLPRTSHSACPARN
eukprot:XP_014001811.1 PREDICTED: uncharacterized protein LOC106572284 [Salmo salar]